MRRFFQAIIFLLLWGLLLGGGYVFYDAHTFLSTPASSAPAEVIFSIKQGATFDRVAWDLKKAGVITDVLRFRLLAQYKDVLGKVRAGEYLLSTGWTPEQVLLQITQGQALLYRLSIREGLTWWETAKAVEEQGFARYEDFKEVIHDPEFLRTHNIPFKNAEGFLYPETYMLKKPRSPLDKEQAREVADVMVRMFWKKTEPLWREMPKRAGASESAGQLGVPRLPSKPGAMTSVPAAKDALGEPSASATSSSSAATLSLDSIPASVPSALADQGAASLLGSADVRPRQGEAGFNLPSGDTGTLSVPFSPAAPPGSGEAASAGDGVYRGAASNATAPATPAPSEAAKPEIAGAQQGGATAPPAYVEGTGVLAPEANATAASPAPPASQPETAPAPPVEAPKADGPQTPAEVEPKAIRHLVILASLVEKETGVPEERDRVAGVYANRLRLNMLLQCDPTIIYGIGPDFTGAIRRSQIDDARNLYNTYQHPGLPPGPICSSGFASLKAAFSPEKHDFLYFVATGLDAGHTFSKSLNEHNKAVQLYRTRIRAVKNNN